MIDRLERALSRAIDGGVAAVFRLRLQPAEIGRKLEHAMLRSRRTSGGQCVVANVYNVYLHPGDFTEFADWVQALERELERWLAEAAYHHGVAMQAPLTITVAERDAVPQRAVEVVGGFSEPGHGTPAAAALARLIPLSGPGEILVLPGREATVGRAPDNDLVLSDTAVSRQHARLRRTAMALEVTDLGSRNGTWVNGARVTHHLARTGDEIAFGTASFRLDLR